MIWNLKPLDVSLELFEHVDKGGRGCHPFLNRKAETVSLKTKMQFTLKLHNTSFLLRESGDLNNRLVVS